MLSINRKIKIMLSVILCVTCLSILFFMIRVNIGKIEMSAYQNGQFTVLLKNQLCIVSGQTEKYVYTGGKELLYRIEKVSLTAEQIVIETPISYIRSLYVINDDHLLIGHSRGMLVIKDGIEINITAKDGLPDERVTFINLSSDGNFLIGTWNGAARYSPDKGIYGVFRDGLLDPMVNCIYEDDYGGVWYGSCITRNGGISILQNDGSWYYFDNSSALPNTNINQFLPLANGEILAATGYLDKGGAAFLCYENGSWRITRTLTVADGLAGDKARSVLARVNGDIWIGSEYDGLAVFFSDGRSLIMNKKDGLPHDEVMTMLEDENGNIWLGTFAGMAIMKNN